MTRTGTASIPAGPNFHLTKKAQIARAGCPRSRSGAIQSNAVPGFGMSARHAHLLRDWRDKPNGPYGSGLLPGSLRASSFHRGSTDV